MLNQYYPQFILLGMIVLIAAAIDWRRQRIPNLVTLPAILIGIALNSFQNSWEGLLFSLTGLALGIGIFLLPYVMGGMGAGDAKLMGAIGAFIGYQGAFISFIYIAVIGGVYAFIVMIRRGTLKHDLISTYFSVQQFAATRNLTLEKVETGGSVGRKRLSYGVAMALGTLLYIGMEISGCHLID